MSQTTSAKADFLPEILFGQTEGIHAIVGKPGEKDGARNSGKPGRRTVSTGQDNAATEAFNLNITSEEDDSSLIVGSADNSTGFGVLESKPEVKLKGIIEISRSLAGTVEMLRVMGVPRVEDVVDVRYRGNGWPGHATATLRDGSTRTLTYDESWGRILQRHRPWRCHVCADHTGEFADIAVGDPWYRVPQPDDPGRSLVLARTERGRALVAAALEAGALVLDRVGPEILAATLEPTDLVVAVVVIEVVEDLGELGRVGEAVEIVEQVRPEVIRHPGGPVDVPELPLTGRAVGLLGS